MNLCNEKLVWDLEICKNISLLKTADEIIIYGAAERGKEIAGWLKNAGIFIDHFCDMDIKKWGNSIGDVEIISPFKLKNIEMTDAKEVYVIACIQYPKEFCRLAEELELKNIRVVTYWGIWTAIHLNAESIYTQNSKQPALFEIEKGLRKHKYMNVGFEFLHKLITAPEDTIWIVQPGKTASSSLEARLYEKGVPFVKEHHLKYPDHILGAEYKQIWENALQEKKSLKIIAAVREPLARDYSAFWQAFTEGLERSMLMPILNRDFQQMYESFTSLIMKGSVYTRERLGVSMPYTWNDEFEWFDEQMKEYLNIDVFQYPFNKEKGYTIIKKENIELFLLKVEKMEDILDEISSFAGVDRLPAINANVGEKKWYGLAYSQFRKEVRLTNEYVDHYYRGNSKMDFFYSQEEKAEFLNKWRGNMDHGMGYDS